MNGIKPSKTMPFNKLTSKLGYWPGNVQGKVGTPVPLQVTYYSTVFLIGKIALPVFLGKSSASFSIGYLGGSDNSSF